MNKLAAAVVIIEIIERRRGGSHYTFMHRHFYNCLQHSVAFPSRTVSHDRIYFERMSKTVPMKVLRDNDRISSEQSLRSIFCTPCGFKEGYRKLPPTSDLHALNLFVFNFLTIPLHQAKSKGITIIFPTRATSLCPVNSIKILLHFKQQWRGREIIFRFRKEKNFSRCIIYNSHGNNPSTLNVVWKRDVDGRRISSIGEYDLKSFLFFWKSQMKN